MNDHVNPTLMPAIAATIGAIETALESERKQADIAENKRLQSLADQHLADARKANFNLNDVMIAALQNAYGYLVGAHTDHGNVQAHVERALVAAGASFQVEDAV